MHKMIVATMMIFSSTFFNSSLAATPDGKFQAYSVGNAPCSSYLDELAKSQANAQIYYAWIAGYLTATTNMSTTWMMFSMVRQLMARWLGSQISVILTLTHFLPMLESHS